MGYACPVCGDPQADGEHLANHLAFTAMLGDGDHEAWLDDHAPDWADSDPGELAATVAEHADEREFPQVFEDTTGRDTHDHRGADRAGERSDTGSDSGEQDVASVKDLLGESGGDADVDDVLAEARELTQRRRGSDDADGPGSEDSDDTGGSDGD